MGFWLNGEQAQDTFTFYSRTWNTLVLPHSWLFKLLSVL